MRIYVYNCRAFSHSPQLLPNNYKDAVWMLGKNKMGQEPIPPESIPKYVREGVERQDSRTLRDIAQWVEELAEWKECEVEIDEIEGDLEADDQIGDIVDENNGTIVTKKVPCGKDCGGCPHGPYTYRVTRSGDSLDWEYLGKTEAN